MLEKFEPLLKQAMGLDIASIGSTAIQRAVRERISACKLSDVHAYWEHVRTSQAELQELIEAVVIPETWFFRDPGAFAALARVAQEEWLRAGPERSIRVLSLPCSSGEEPYSMVMALTDSGFPVERLHVDAVDISRHALARARRAIYIRNSFRGNDFGFRDRHFESMPNGYRLAEALRKPVNFLHGNMVDADFMPGAAVYDAIFCRNLLIYFDRVTQDRAIGVLTGLLAPNGVLFVGPSETNLLLTHNFVSTKFPLAFAFRKAGAVAPAVVPKTGPGVAESPKRSTPAPLARAPRQKYDHSRKKPATIEKPSRPAADTTSLDEIERLANRGELVRAMQHCEKYLREQEPSARAFYLMGLVHDAAGREREAQSQYRRALYLDPTFDEALIHLAFLLEKQGDMAGAKVLHARVGRAQKNKMGAK